MLRDENHLEVLELDPIPPAQATAVQLLPSRAQAVDRILRGTALGVLGTGACWVANLPLLGSRVANMFLAFGGLTIAGIGLGIVGFAAIHLARFGGKRGPWILGGVGAVGLSIISWTIGLLLGSDWLALGGAMGLVGSVGLVVLLAIGFVIEWARSSVDAVASS
jgi:hypothetical protein